MDREAAGAESGPRVSPHLAGWLWEDRLLQLDEDALRLRLAVKKFRPRKHQIDQLAAKVLEALDAESAAIDALEAEARRQEQQQQRALKYG